MKTALYPPNIKQILSRLIRMTAERDSASLEISLVKTLFELVAPGEIIIYRPTDIEQHLFATMQADGEIRHEVIPDQLLADLMYCLQNNQAQLVLSAARVPVMLYPLFSAKNKPLAVMAIESSENNPQLHDLTQMLLEIYKNFTSLMSDNELDTLTGLYNRKTFELKISKVFSDLQRGIDRRSDEPLQPFYLAIFDIDHFKRVNDQFGHLVGDEVLLLFARQMVHAFREKDILFRFGGEEFVGIFQCADSDSMQHVLDGFRQKIEAFDFPQVGKVTVSAGYTEIQPFDVSSNIIGRADTALYYAKNNGRNQVCYHELLLAQGSVESNQIEGEIELF